ncbi:hypothetical protein GCM10011583_54090 [Streptomyces camponoticapitis]|uniref:Integral membrane protein n=1 Tax=Streptomyces camponoticapitis TaxID=1616125 RepID=A0ABQ2EL74_9ACTN|nr:hypothetical protein [Streptomyces camponoticapitis]GGK15307.1 hypothetical protein GCM10011583_54090 [Streptomyces camponoticapitis]
MTRYGYPGASAPRDEGRGAAVFALARAWAAGIVVLLVTEYLQTTLVNDHLATSDNLETFNGRLMLIHLPNAVCIALATWAAGRSHREPFRDSKAQHVLAVFTVGLAAQALNMVMQWQDLEAEGILMSNAVLVVGVVSGYAAERLQDD